MRVSIQEYFGRIGIGNLLLLGSILLYVILYFVSPTVFSSSMNYVISLFYRLIPVLVLVYVITFLFNLFIKPNTDLSVHDPIKLWISSIVGGILSSGPIYMWYPLLSSLKEKGLKDRYIATFLYNRGVKIPLLPLMVQYFGLPFVGLMTLLMVVFSIFNGYATEYLMKMFKR